MSNTKWTKEKELSDRTYPYRLGYLSGSCKTAIIELETFLENRKEVLSESDYNYLDSTMKALKVGLENSVNNKF